MDDEFALFAAEIGEIERPTVGPGRPCSEISPLAAAIISSMQAAIPPIRAM